MSIVACSLALATNAAHSAEEMKSWYIELFLGPAKQFWPTSDPFPSDPGAAYPIPYGLSLGAGLGFGKVLVGAQLNGAVTFYFASSFIAIQRQFGIVGRLFFLQRGVGPFVELSGGPAVLVVTDSSNTSRPLVWGYGGTAGIGYAWLVPWGGAFCVTADGGYRQFSATGIPTIRAMAGMLF